MAQYAPGLLLGVLVAACAASQIKNPHEADSAEVPGDTSDGLSPADSGGADTSSSDTAVSDTAASDTAEDSGVIPKKPDPCAEAPDPDRDPSFGAVLVRLEEQGCLHEDDIDLADAFMAERIQSEVYCDQVWRVHLDDDQNVLEEPELVVPSASVPDVLILEDGSHLLVYNDLRPELFMTLIREDPARFWRQGLIGYGGVGMSIDRRDGKGFVEVEDLDLQLDRLHQAVDPDLGWAADGTVRLVWFGILTDVMEKKVTAPLGSPMPHRFYRTTAQSEWVFDPPALAVSSWAGSTGGVDPTVLTLNDGGEILYLGPLDHYAMGWHSEDTVTWPKDPDVETTVPAATPDVQPDPEGGFRMFYMRNGSPGSHESQRSEDGFIWNGHQRSLHEAENTTNPTADFDSDGNIWLYYNQQDEACAKALDLD